jgi:replicative DNA helicase
MIAFLARIDVHTAQASAGQAAAGPANWAARAIASAPLVIDDRPFLTVNDLAGTVMWNSVQCGIRNGLTVVLAPELLQVAARWRRNPVACAPLVRALRDLGETYGGAVLCEIPLGRAAEERDNHWPLLTDLEGFSRGFARDADAVLLIYRPFVYDLSAWTDAACVITARNRFGRCGGASLAFEFKGGFSNCLYPSMLRLPLEEPLRHRPTNACIVSARSGNAFRTALSAVTRGTDSALASATNSAS